jgi:hypothetical protein
MTKESRLMYLKGTLTLAAIAVIAFGMPTAYAGYRHHHRSYSNFSIGIGFSGYPYSVYGYYPYGYSGYSYYPYGYGYPSSYGYYSSYRPVYRGQYANNSSVVRLQERLARAGYYHGAIDGVMGPRTRYAIRAYERDHGRLRY